MRFFEFNKSDTDLESALINILMNMKGDADEKEQASDISMDAVKQIMSNTGYPAFNYDVFKRIYDAAGDLQNVVADFDNEKIVVRRTKRQRRILRWTTMIRVAQTWCRRWPNLQ